MVKNTVIVPVGAKGGFVAKQLPDPSVDRDAWLAEGIASYKTFISALLDITDNLVAGEVVQPSEVVRHDEDDTYLVVAADKGTATFSDIANGVAESYGFWLGDAFASGGSAGYDHKGMGITARGAWESVKRNFRELGHDTQTEDFTVVGIGDMSGDVFGNGMLLSEHIRLVAAFDHRHIFLDPNPDATVSFAERRRLFDVPRSSWDDYDKSLISAGGGVFPRSAKSIQLSAQVRERLGSRSPSSPGRADEGDPAVPVDLFWNGGIGTYIKSSAETNAEVGDKSNDAIRVNGGQVRARVVGEGGNLGCTQLGRIEYASTAAPRAPAAGSTPTPSTTRPGRGHLGPRGQHQDPAQPGRRRRRHDGQAAHKLLAEMTDEVGHLVLRNNYAQNVVLANAVAQALSMVDVHARMINRLEGNGQLDRAIEFLPTDRQIKERAAGGRGLSQPELSVLLAYTKITLADELLATELPDDPYFRTALHEYFPSALRARFAEAIDQHPLRREIITTLIVNDTINRGGCTFAFRLREETGATMEEIARTHAAARAVFGLERIWSDVRGPRQRRPGAGADQDAPAHPPAGRAGHPLDAQQPAPAAGHPGHHRVLPVPGRPGLGQPAQAAARRGPHLVRGRPPGAGRGRRAGGAGAADRGSVLRLPDPGHRRRRGPQRQRG
ncbi:hypothetical protein GCM10020229_76740 [Kitasatospora albolonga]